MYKSFKKAGHTITAQFSPVNNCYFIRHTMPDGVEQPPELFHWPDQAQQRYRQKVDFLKQVTS